MSVTERETKSKKKKGVGKNEVELISWREKKNIADNEEEMLGKEVEELITWTSLIESMDDEELKEYVLNRPENMQTMKIGKSASSKRVQRNTGKAKCSPSSGLMDVIWKFHREEEEETSVRSH